MRILVTGGNGQLGLSLRKISGKHPCDTFCFSDLPEADITDRTAVEKLVRGTEPDVIINCAAYTAVDKAESEPDTARRINAEGPGILARICKEKGIKLIQISTDYVFGGTASAPIKEEDPTGPLNVYGQTKLEGERAVEVSGCDAAVIRTGWLYSEFGNNFVKTMLRLGKERGTVNVVCDQKGTPTYAPDLAEAAVAIAKKGIRGFNIFHYSNTGETTWYGFAMEIFRLAGMDTAVNPVTTPEYPTPAERPMYSVLSKERITAAGIVIPGWETSLKTCIGELARQDKN